MKLEDAVKLYLKNSLIMKSEGTYNFEREHLKALFSLLGNINLEDIDFYYVIEQYRNKGLSNNTINKRVSLLKRLLNYFNVKYDNVKKLREEINTFAYLTITEIELLVNHIKITLNKYDKKSIRNALILLVLVDTGIRLNELMHLTKNDYNAKKGYLLIKRTKNKKQRIVYLSDYTNILLKDNMTCLFGQKITYSIIARLFKNIKDKLGFQKFSPHVLRHSLATNLIIKGADIYFVGRVLGHSSLNITKRYLHLDNEFMKETYNKYYPY